MIKYSKILFTNPAHITISGIEICYENLFKIINIFNLKQAVVEIDSLSADARLLAYIVEQGLCCNRTTISNDSVEICVRVQGSLLNQFLRLAIEEGPEYIFIYDLCEDEGLFNPRHHSLEHFVECGIISVLVAVAFDKSTVEVSMNKFQRSPKEIIKMLRATQLTRRAWTNSAFRR